MASRHIIRNLITVKPVCLDYADLLTSIDLHKEIEEAYSHAGLGLLTVKNIPGYSEKRNRLLPLANSLALLPESARITLERPELKYIVGWSHGKEHFEGQPDFSKGSYYANPIVDSAPFPNTWPANVWPGDLVPDLEAAFKSLGREINRIGALLCKHLDRFIEQRNKAYIKNTLEDMVTKDKGHIGRLLHYFPKNNENKGWCGWHNDHGALTGLTSSMYIEQETGRIVSASETGDLKVGLFVRSRKGELIKVKAGAEELCFQIGETAQVVSGGILQATPHAVVNEGGMPGVSRNTFALFMQPREGFVMNSPLENTDFPEHEGIPSLTKRWKQGMTFHEFHVKTVSLFN